MTREEIIHLLDWLEEKGVQLASVQEHGGTYGWYTLKDEFAGGPDLEELLNEYLAPTPWTGNWGYNPHPDPRWNLRAPGGFPRGNVHNPSLFDPIAKRINRCNAQEVAAGPCRVGTWIWETSTGEGGYVDSFVEAKQRVVDSLVADMACEKLEDHSEVLYPGCELWRTTRGNLYVVRVDESGDWWWFPSGMYEERVGGYRYREEAVANLKQYLRERVSDAGTSET